jgi:hypothetical protein
METLLLGGGSQISDYVVHGVAPDSCSGLERL